MSRVKHLRPAFVDRFPDDPSAGVLYVSVGYATALHLCACGCGREVVTPLRPRQWQVSFDGENLSLTPSVANWSFPCRSHYWINDGRVHWVASTHATRIASWPHRVITHLRRLARRPTSRP